MTVKNSSDRFLKLTGENDDGLVVDSPAKDIVGKTNLLTSEEMVQSSGEEYMNGDTEQVPSNLFVAYQPQDSDQSPSKGNSDKDDDLVIIEDISKEIQSKETKPKNKASSDKKSEKLNKAPEEELEKKVLTEKKDSQKISKIDSDVVIDQEIIKKTEKSKKVDEKEAKTNSEVLKVVIEKQDDEIIPEIKFDEDDLEDTDDNDSEDEEDLEESEEDKAKVAAQLEKDKANLTAQLIEDNINSVGQSVLTFIEKEANDICNKYIEEMSKQDCIRKHKNLYSLLISKKLRPDSIENKEKKQIVENLMNAAWYFVSDPYDYKKMNLEQNIENQLNAKGNSQRPDEDSLNKANLNEKAMRHLYDFDNSMDELKGLEVLDSSALKTDAKSHIDKPKTEQKISSIKAPKTQSRGGVVDVSL